MEEKVIEGTVEESAVEVKEKEPQTAKVQKGYIKTIESVMSSDFLSLQGFLTVEQAFKHIRKNADEKKRFGVTYIIDENNTLLGYLSATQLILAEPKQKIEEIYSREVVSVNKTTKKSDAVDLLRENALVSLPVVDDEQKLIGVVTRKACLDMIQQKATNEMENMAGMKASTKPYLETSSLRLAGGRMLWLTVFTVLAILIGVLIEVYEGAFTAWPALVAFIPVIMASGGNCGAQSSTVIIRGMSLNEIKHRNFFKVMLKEFWVSIMCCVVVGGLVFAYSWIRYDNALLALVIWLGLVVTIIFAKILGVVLPMLAKKLKLDAALISSPAITIIADLIGVFAFFTFAQIILNI